MQDELPITIYHDPEDPVSREALGRLEDAGFRPEVIDVRAAGWQADVLRFLVAQMGLRPRELLRQGEPMAESLGLLDAGATDEGIVDAMLRYPGLVACPIVKTADAVRLCRPAAVVAEILDQRAEKPTDEDHDPAL